MSTVNLTIGPRTYPVTCGDGEEAQVERLAQLISDKYNQLGKARTARESQNLVFTALLLADELSEKSKQSDPGREINVPEKLEVSGKKAELKAEIKLLRGANTALTEELEQLRGAAGQPDKLLRIPGEGDAELIKKLEMLAARAEAAADALEAGNADA
ncbi:MAG: cell division protein ZapA [Pseudomonadota bacterium]